MREAICVTSLRVVIEKGPAEKKRYTFGFRHSRGPAQQECVLRDSESGLQLWTRLIPNWSSARAVSPRKPKRPYDMGCDPIIAPPFMEKLLASQSRVEPCCGAREPIPPFLKFAELHLWIEVGFHTRFKSIFI